MTLIVKPLPLTLNTPFRIAHGTSFERHNVLVQIGDGLGEGAPNLHYGYTQAEALTYLQNINLTDLVTDDPLALVDALDRIPAGPAPARAAVDMALHDQWAKKLGYPLYRLWGLNPQHTPLSSVTLSIPEDKADLQQQLKAVAGWQILKIKLGTGDLDMDEDIVRMVHQESKAQLCVDANGAWSVDEAAQIIPRLVEYDLLFIEQPISAERLDAWPRLRRLLPADVPPLIADESVQHPRDVTALAGVANGINIKLSKVGGLRPAQQMIALARTLGLQVLLGCMVESSLSITAAAHLAPLVDYVDLDGHLNLSNDPFVGVNLERGKVTLPQDPGLGVIRRLS